jgi:hypothetical protein
LKTRPSASSALSSFELANIDLCFQISALFALESLWFASSQVVLAKWFGYEWRKAGG